MTGFVRQGGAVPASPVVVSVPHAGREYPDALLALLRVPPAALVPLEDRCVDRVALAAVRDETLFVQRRARAWIDLNRGEHERDPRVDAGVNAATLPFQSAKVRGGLGLVPRRSLGPADLWRRRLTAAEMAQRIEGDHRPYHAALAAALAAARARFGTAVLLDVHSMPSLPPGGAGVVIGDRFGRSAGARLVERVEGAVRAHGLTAALNTPYAGGHVLDRHGNPQAGVHAVQLELDRAAYLDAGGLEPGPGFAHVVAALRGVIDALADEAVPAAMAAE